MIDMMGQRFGRLQVVRFAGTDRRGEARWECACDCGKTHTVLGSHLRSGRIQSCGCYLRERTSARMKGNCSKGNTRHGCCHTRLYETWTNMKTRCFNKDNRAYKWYGAKGITICTEWMSFENFQKWALNSGYKDDLTIERINPFGNYEPSNCTWIPKSDQWKNQRRSKQWQDLN